MATQEEFLDRLWEEVINSNMNGAWIASKIAYDRDHPDVPFGEVGQVLQRMLDKGVSREDICRLARQVAYGACFSTLYMMEDPGLDEGELDGIHESVLDADPSGKEAGPGSWPYEPQRPAAKASPAATGPILTVPRAFSIAFSPDSRLVAMPSGGAVLEVASGKQVSKCSWPSNTTRLVFFPSGDRIAGVNTAGVVAICDVETGRPLQKYKMKCEGNALAVSPDGRLVVAGNWDGDLFLWDVETGAEIARRQFADATIRNVCFSRNSKTAYVAGYVKNYTGNPELFVSVLNAKLSRQTGRTSISRVLDHLAFSADFALVAAYGYRDPLATHSLADGKPIGKSELVEVKEACISPDGKVVGAACRDSFVFLDAATLKVIGRVQREYANHVSFSPDGRLVGLATWNKGEVWDTQALLAEIQ